MIAIKRIAVLLPAALLALPLHAQEPVPETTGLPPLYTIEVILFRYTEDVFAGSEVFPPERVPPGAGHGTTAGGPGVPGVIDAGELAPPEAALPPEGVLNPEEPGESSALPVLPGGPAGAVLLLDDELTMRDVVRKLDQLDVYEPVLHVGWMQAAAAEGDAVPVELRFFGSMPAGFDGQLTLYLGRFLHLVVDVAMDADPDSATLSAYADDAAPSYGDGRMGYDDPFAIERERVLYRIREDRIMKSGDIRYFDHPRFGVIAKLTRVEPAAEPTGSELMPRLSGLIR